MKKLIFKNAQDNRASSRIKEKTGALLLCTEEDGSYHGPFKTQEVWELIAENWAKYCS